MGPTVLFDKSMLQSLNVNESVWFDHFFTTIISPMFFAETLADLAKKTAKCTPEREVANISLKTPDKHAAIQTFHQTLCLGDLLGNHFPMDGRPVVPSPRSSRGQGRRSVVWKPAAEMEAFDRWQAGQFGDVERDFAKRWRDELRRFDFRQGRVVLDAFGIDLREYKNITTLVQGVRQAVEATARSEKALWATFDLLRIPDEFQGDIGLRWLEGGRLCLAAFAPYAAFVIAVDLSLYGALQRGFISRDRASNRVDFAYLYYLPFCMIFTSGDKLHRQCAPPFLREDQIFVGAREFKSDLGRLQKHYAAFSVRDRELGLYQIAPLPPDGDFITTSLWDRFCPRWRVPPTPEEAARLNDADMRGHIVDQINQIADGAGPVGAALPEHPNEIDGMLTERHVRGRRGDWWPLPKTLDDDIVGS